MPATLTTTPEPTRPRYAMLDTLRGALLVLMALNHITSDFRWLTQQPFGYATAAEGFIFLAGLVVGLVYSRRWLKSGPLPTSRLLLKRCAVIYGAHLASIAGISLWMLFYSRTTGSLPVGSPWPWFHQPLETYTATLFLLHQPGLLDVLPTYCGLLLISPIILWAFSKNRMGLVLGISAVIWAITNLIDPPKPTILDLFGVHGLINTGAFNFGAWQFLYTIGLALGHRWSKNSLPSWHLHPVYVWGALVCVVILSALSHEWIHHDISEQSWWLLTNKNNLAPVRLFNVLLLVILIHAWARASRREIQWAPLSLLGRHSLAVFSVHCVVAIIILGMPRFFADTSTGRILGPLVMLTAMFTTAMISEARKQGWFVSDGLSAKRISS
ncbi:MAG: OpgC domain-containing protein [Luteolibacter sp.]